MTMFNLKTLSALCMAAALAGCGGSGGDDNTLAAMTPTSGVPQSAQQSVTGLVAFLEQLIAQTSETSEPITLGDAVLPTSETL